MQLILSYYLSPRLADFIDELMGRLPTERPANTQVILQRLAEIERALYPSPAPTPAPTRSLMGGSQHNFNKTQSAKPSKFKPNIVKIRRLLGGICLIGGVAIPPLLTTLLNEQVKNKQSEAKTYVGAMNRAQKVYFLENDSFTGELDLAILCEADYPGRTKPATPTYRNGRVTCGEGTTAQ